MPLQPDPHLIDRIYEAAALPDKWPIVLESIADAVGGFGATFVSQTPHGAAVMATPRIERIVSDYIAEGWAADPEYAKPLYTDFYPGFRAETHYRTIEEIERLPVHVEFLAPRGLIAGVGTVLQGAKDDMLQVALEGLPSHPAAEAAALWLDQLRAPLARSLSLTARLREAEAATAVATLNLVGVPAAIVSSDGRLRATNDRFLQRLGNRLIDRTSGLRFDDRALQAQYAKALGTLNVAVKVRSIAVAARGNEQAFAIHLLPIRRGARDVFGWDGVLLFVAEAANASVPGADLLRLLFDLTPAEARLARQIVDGESLTIAARASAISVGTARAQLKTVFAKTGVQRQAELVRLLVGLGVPDG